MARRLRRFDVLALVLLLGTAIVAVLSAFAGSDTRCIQSAIDRLIVAVRFDARRESSSEHHARLERALDELVEPDVVVRISDLPRVGGRGQLLELASDDTVSRIELDLSDASVSVDGDRATARARAALSTVKNDHELRERRNVTLGFVRNNGAFRISSLEIAPRTNEQPEARP